MSWVWTDHIRKCQFVNVAVPTFSGVKDVNFRISEDGMNVKIQYTWPSSMFNPVQLFSNEIQELNSQTSVNHPKIHALASMLLSRGITEKSGPKGQIIVALPVKIQRECGSWTKKAVKKNDGTKIILLEFKGFQEDTHIKEADTNLSFD